MLSCVPLFGTPWTVARQVPLSMGFPRQEYWSGMLFPSLRDLPDPGIKPKSPALQMNSLWLSHLGSHVGSQVNCVLIRSVASDAETLWTVNHEAPLFLGFFKQEYWSGLPFPSPGDLPNLGMEPASPESLARQVVSLPLSC